MPQPAPEPPESEHTLRGDEEPDNSLESYEIPDRILRYDIPCRAWAQRMKRFLYEQQYQRRFNVLIYRKKSEPQTRFFGLVEKTDIDWRDCTQEEYELWNERRVVRRGSDEQTIVGERGEDSDDEDSDDKEVEEEHKVTWCGVV